MTEYIKREDAIKAISDWYKPNPKFPAKFTEKFISKMSKLINDVPAADVISKDDLLKVLSEIDGRFNLRREDHG